MEETIKMTSEIGEVPSMVKIKTPEEEIEILKGKIVQSKKMIQYAKQEITFFKSLKNYSNNQLKANQKSIIESYEVMEKNHTFLINDLYAQLQTAQEEAKKQKTAND